MTYNTSLANANSFYSAGKVLQATSSNKLIARVLDVVLDPSHPDYKIFGNDEAINGIRYKLINSTQGESNPSIAPFAYNGNIGFFRVPLKNELVEIEFEPSNSSTDLNYKQKAYYTRILSTWNNVHHNASPDLLNSTENIDLGPDVVERSEIKSLSPFSGDTIVEGRLGQSLRFSGFYSKLNPLTFEDKSNNGNPYAILRIGQDGSDTPLSRYTEDINLDKSSIYLTSDHIVNLQPSNSKQDSYNNGDNRPVLINSYRGNQVIIDSGRLVFHSKEDHILINSKNSIGMSGTSINLDGEAYVSLDSSKIYLGKSAQEPVLKGDSTIQLLQDLIDALSSLMNTHQLAVNPALASTQLIAGSAELNPKLQVLQSRLNSLKSKKVFVE